LKKLERKEKLNYSKPGKYPMEPESYQLISLTNCMCELMERMINKRLTFTLEVNIHMLEKNGANQGA
jgi:hypothetical protein